MRIAVYENHLQRLTLWQTMGDPPKNPAKNLTNLVNHNYKSTQKEENVYIKSDLFHCMTKSLRSSQFRNDFLSNPFKKRDLLTFEWIVEYELTYSHFSITSYNFGKGVC